MRDGVAAARPSRHAAGGPGGPHASAAFVAEATSVILQVGYFKFTKRKYGQGRRIFLMSPLHLHFLKKGWHETQVVIRFWLVGAMLAMLALATIKLR